MTIIKKLGSYSLIILGVFAFAPSLGAQVLNTSVNVNGTLDLGQQSSTSLEASVNAGVGTQTPESDGEEDVAFDAYARATIESDENVSDIESDSDSVSLRYKDRARLLGFIPVTISAEAVVSADGSVEVSYPWYRFLTVYDRGELEADIEASAGAIARAEGGATLSTEAKTRIVDAVRSVMRAHYEANLEAGASSSQEVEVE